MKFFKYHVSSILILLTLLFVFHLSMEVKAGNVEETVPKKVIYFSAITLYHPILMYQRYQPLMNYLTENTPYRFELKLSQDYNDIIKFLKNNEVQVALLGGVTYLKAKKEFGVIPILKPLGVDGKPFYRCVFITQDNNRKINKLADCKGKSMAFASKLSTSGSLVPLYHLHLKAGIKPNDLLIYEHFKYHDTAAREVLRGNFDAGAVIDGVANKFKNKGLKVIDISEPIPGLPIVVRKDASSKLIRSIKMALLTLDYNNPEHRKIMDQWDEELKYGFAKASDSDYDIIRKMENYLIKKGIKIH